MGSPAVGWQHPGGTHCSLRAALHFSLSYLQLVLGFGLGWALQVRNELTMYGRVGNLADDLIRPALLLHAVVFGPLLLSRIRHISCSSYSSSDEYVSTFLFIAVRLLMAICQVV